MESLGRVVSEHRFCKSTQGVCMRRMALFLSALSLLSCTCRSCTLKSES